MKDKPISHKNQNTFKFESFKDQLAKVNLSTLHHRNSLNYYSDEKISNFAQTLDHWLDLNCTSDFEELKQAIGNFTMIQSLPQIVLKKEELVQILIGNLNKQDNKALEVVLDLIAALSRDLQYDFYPYLFDFIQHLVNLLEIQESELIERIFLCLAHLFKFLWRYIVKDFDKVYNLYSNRLLLSSQKWYIRQFASEAFSFLIRKVEDKNKCIEMIFENLEQNPNIIQGVGELLFETMKGTKQHVHSCCHEFFNLIIGNYTKNNFSNENVKKIILITLELLAKYVSHEESKMIWDVLLLDSSYHMNEQEKVIDFVAFLVENYHRLIVDPSKLMNFACSLLKLDVADQHKTTLLQIISCLLLNCEIETKQLKTVLDVVYTNDKLNSSEILNFSRNIFGYSLFEYIFLPSLQQYCLNMINGKDSIRHIECLKVLVDLISLKVPRPIFGEDLINFTKYPLGSKTLDNEKFVKKIIEIFLNESDLDVKKLCLICISNFDYGLNNDEICGIIQNNVFNSEQLLSPSLLIETILAMILIRKNIMIDMNYMLTLLKSNPHDTHVLQAFDFYLTNASINESENNLQLQYLEEVYLISLEPNLSSFKRLNRLLSLHILTLFDVPLPPSDEPNLPTLSIFQICLNAEKIIASIENYREKIKYFQSLDFSYGQKYIPLPGVSGVCYDLMPIHYLLGALYENFSLLWQPIQSIIQTYASGYHDSKKLFNVIFQHIQTTTKYIYNNQVEMNRKENEDYMRVTFNDRPDHGNHRLLLLKTLSSVSGFLEPRNREFVNLFLKFYQEEVVKLSMICSQSFENLSIECKEPSYRMNDENETKSVYKNKPILWKTFSMYLEIFSKFENPRTVYRESELKELYLNLLKFYDTKVQTFAFKCILTYDYHYLKQYKEYFDKIINDKTFKSAFLLLSMNSQNQEDNVIEKEHRSDVMPILMRIIYGKMLSSNAIKVKGKHYAENRRSFILRILAGCKQDELILFMNLAFSSIANFISHDYNVLQQAINKSIDINQFIPISQLQALTNTLNSMVEYLSNNSLQINCYIYKVLIVISSLVNHLLSNYRSQIKESVISKIKAIRTLCYKIAIRFFNYSSHYNFSHDEIQSFFQCLVCPSLKDLENESLSTPSSLLKLLACWSTNTKYFQFLSKQCYPNQTLSPISVICSLYKNSKANSKVISLITELLNNLVNNGIEKSVEDEDMNESEENSNLGVDIIVPHISNILIYFREKFQREAKTGKRNNEFFNLTELNILSRMSEYVTFSEESSVLFNLLIASINKKQDEETQLQTLKTANVLAKHIKAYDPKTLTSLAPLFGQIFYHPSRIELCDILSKVYQNNHLSKMISQINTFSSKNPDQPNYNVRLEAFKSIKQLIEEEDFNIEFSLILTYNCCYFIYSLSYDLTIRESATKTIISLIEKISKVKNELTFNEFALKTLLNRQIRPAIKHKMEVIRHEFVRILVSLIQNCHKRHHIFKQLHLLCNSDEELDFWANIRHIQIHKRTKALKRLSKDEKLISTISVSLISSILLPLANQFLDDERIQKDNILAGEVIDSIGGFCSYLPWIKYSNFLKFYLKLLVKKLDHKLVVKVIISILNNFNFNLSSLTNDLKKNSKKNQLKLKSVTKVKSTAKQLNHKAAKKIYDDVTNSLIAELHNCLNQKSKIDFAHSSTRISLTEDDEIRRIPLALAIVKLIKHLPEQFGILEMHLPNILLRLCQFLQSRSENIRETSRATLGKIMLTLGSRYLSYALKELRSTLTKGYQLHILIYTVHSILISMSSILNVGDLDNCLDTLIETFNMELFTIVNEEKEVKQITSKLKEARKCKSYDAYRIVASYVSEDFVMKLIQPLKNVLAKAHDHTVIKRANSCLLKITVGLNDNKGLNEKTLLIFIYGIINDTIPDIKKKENDKKKQVKIQNQPDSFLLPIQTKKAKVNHKTNSHILTEFGIQLLYSLLKRNRMRNDDPEHLSLLDPFIGLLEKFLDCNYLKLTILSLKSLNLLISKFASLSSLRSISDLLVKNIFFLINKYAGAGLKKDENSQIVTLSFKGITLLIKEIEDFQLNDQNLNVLLTYIENNLYDNNRQTTAFLLLKAILIRKFKAPELEDIMKKIAEMSIVSQSDHIRDKSRQLWLIYLRDYKHGNKFRGYILFFIKQLEYQHESGRQSALEFFNLILSSLQRHVVLQNVELLFISLSLRLLNEVSLECKKLSSQVINKLLYVIEQEKRTDLLKSYLLPWFQDKNILQRQLAAQLYSIFIDVEKETFIDKTFSTCLPLISQQLNPERYKNDDVKDDNLIYNLINILIKSIKIKPDLVKNDKYLDEINVILENVQKFYLMYPHTWVRLISLQLFGLIFSNYSTETIAGSIINCSDGKEYLLNKTEEKLVELSKCFGLLLRDIYDKESLADQIIKNFLYIARVALLLPEKNEQQDNEEPSNKGLNLKWLIKILIKEVKYEVTNDPSKTNKRSWVFKWIAAIALELGKEKIQDYLLMFLKPICREFAMKSKKDGDPLGLLCKQILDILKDLIGDDKFTMHYTKARDEMTNKKIDRKKKRAIQKVTDPVSYAKKKIRKKLKEKEKKSTKRKFEFDSKKRNKKAKRRRVK